MKEAIADDALGAVERERLIEIERLLAFAAENGFDVGQAYRTYVDTGSGPPVWVLYACRPDELEPRRWRFPIVGVFPYKGFFDRDAARREHRFSENQPFLHR